MKKLLLMSVILVLGLTIFGQNNNTFSREELHEKYKTYIDHNYRPLIFHEWLLYNHFKITPDAQTISSGTYLIKAKRQIISGFVCGVIGGGVAYYGVNQYRNYIGINDDGTAFKVVKGVQIRKICLMGGGALGVIGVVFEITGANKLGKAGIALDENGIGVNIKF